MPLRALLTDLHRPRRHAPRPEALLRRDLATYRTERERAELSALSERRMGSEIEAELGSAVLGVRQDHAVTA